MVSLFICFIWVSICYFSKIQLHVCWRNSMISLFICFIWVSICYCQKNTATCMLKANSIRCALSLSDASAFNIEWTLLCDSCKLVSTFVKTNKRFQVSGKSYTGSHQHRDCSRFYVLGAKWINNCHALNVLCFTIVCFLRYSEWFQSGVLCHLVQTCLL